MTYNYDAVFKLPFTERLYNKSPYVKEINATVLFVENNVAVFDKTIFYAESGGQVSDTGRIISAHNGIFNVIDVQHKFGRKLSIKRTDIDVPYIDVETRIVHVFSSDISLKVGDSIIMCIEWNKRYSIMKNHTLAHFLFYVFNKVYNEKNDNISVKGCAIDENKASFSLNKKISQDDWDNIKYITLKKLKENKKITIIPEEKTDTIFYWQYDDLIIPCGGTHIKEINELDLNNISFRKKNSGKERSKLYISYKNID